MPSFENKKALRFVITLGTAGEQITLEGFRASVDIDKAGGMMMGQLRAKIWGVSQAAMNSATTLQWRNTNAGSPSYIPNTVQVFAIDGTVETLVFSGNIINAWGDYQNMPDVFLHIHAQVAYFDQLKAVPPRSFKGAVDVAGVMAQIAKDMGYSFENGGVDVKLTDVYLANTGVEQARELAKAAGVVMTIDDGTLIILPPNTARKGLVPEISAATGLVSTPTFDGAGVICQMLFNPALRFLGQFKLVTDQARAAGVWVATSIAYRLESEKPGGAWFATVRGNFEGTPYVGK